MKLLAAAPRPTEWFELRKIGSVLPVEHIRPAKLRRHFVLSGPESALNDAQNLNDISVVSYRDKGAYNGTTI
jgi:hypothetical protein